MHSALAVGGQCRVRVSWRRRSEGFEDGGVRDDRFIVKVLDRLELGKGGILGRVGMEHFWNVEALDFLLAQPWARRSWNSWRSAMAQE